MSDLIDRQAAIEAITDELDRIDHVPQWVFDRLEGRLKQLPPAQLGTNLAEVGTRAVRGYPIDADALMEKVAEEYGERARDRLYQIIRYMPPAQPEPCEDAVSRAEVLRMINCINDHQAITPYKSVGAVTEHLTRIASNLPPVTPKQRTGHWIPVGVAEVVGGESAQWGSAVAYHKCSECDEQALRDDFEQEVLSDFCPNCGCRMERMSE